MLLTSAMPPFVSFVMKLKVTVTVIYVTIVKGFFVTIVSTLKQSKPVISITHWSTYFVV